MIPVFKERGIYPIFFIWRTGFFEELLDVLRGRGDRVAARVEEITDLSDVLLEGLAQPIVRPIWREMKKDAAYAMQATSGETKTGDGWEATQILLHAARQTGMKLHFVGHSAGAILLGQLLLRAKAENVSLTSSLGSISLFAPACTEEFFEAMYATLPSVTGGIPTDFTLYNLNDRFERDDSVGPYRKSLLYLVSNSFEDTYGVPLAGFEATSKEIVTRYPAIKRCISDGTPTSFTKARAHGDFDNDPATLNHVLNRVLGVPQGTFGPAKGGFNSSML